MAHIILRLSLISFLFSIFGGQLAAQSTAPDTSNTKEKPAVALLRHRGASSATIETIVDAELVEGSTALVVLYKTEDKISKRLVKKDNVPNCLGTLVKGEICKEVSSPKKIKFVYLFPAAPDAASKYMVAFSVKDVNKGEIEQIVKVAMDFKEIAPVVESFDREKPFHTNNGFGKVDYKPNGVIKIPIVFPAPNDPPNKEFDEYIDERINELYDWLEPRLSDPSAVAHVRIESLVKDNSPVTAGIVGFQIESDNRNTALETRRINILLIIDKNFPDGKFALEVIFLDNPPPEISGKLLNTLPGIEGIKAPKAAEVGGDAKLGLREFKNNFDVGFALTSAVEEVEKEGVKVRERKNNGVLDLRFAPILNALDRNEIHFFTPFFIDAKVSTGKIEKKTLSLNRILLGTQYSIRWRPNNGSFNKYIFTFRGINASDRDFKRVEGKLNFEFRPLFDKLNNPLSVKFVTPLPDSVLIPENGKKIIPKGWFGYQVQPFIGFEAGRVYRVKRDPFNNEENNRNIRRLFMGMDILLNITKYANLKISDTYYIRGESSDARYRNYFNGELEAPLLISGNTSQSVFLSFERGEQPPFATPSVNSFKVGYRITSNFLGRTP